MDIFLLNGALPKVGSGKKSASAIPRLVRQQKDCQLLNDLGPSWTSSLDFQHLPSGITVYLAYKVGPVATKSLSWGLDNASFYCL